MPRVGDPKQRRRHFIREWRMFRGLTQEQLAGRIATTKANISRIENLKQGYTQGLLEACADALMTEPASLIMRNPMDKDSFWSLWEQAKPAERRRIMEFARGIAKPRKRRTAS
jgi:transcriptional regulator with XRE-family HTH domain